MLAKNGCDLMSSEPFFPIRRSSLEKRQCKNKEKTSNAKIEPNSTLLLSPIVIVSMRYEILKSLNLQICGQFCRSSRLSFSYWEICPKGPIYRSFGHFVTLLTTLFFEGLKFHTNLLTAVSTNISRNNQEKSHLVQREKMRSRASWESPDSRGIDMNLSQLITCNGNHVEHGIICIICIMHYLHNMHL